jgi:hypothetical protein
MKTIEVIVASDGSARVETRGFSGPQCQEASRFLEFSLGRATQETLTSEYHEAQAAQTLDQQHSS